MLTTVVAAVAACGLLETPPATTQPVDADGFTIQIKANAPARGPAAIKFTARVTPEELLPLLDLPETPPALRAASQREATAEALERINMAALMGEMQPFLAERFGKQFDSIDDVLVRAVPDNRQLNVEAPDLQPDAYRGPKQEIAGFLLHDVTEAEYIAVGIRVIQRARQLYESGDPIFDRRSPEYYKWLATREVQQIRDGRKRGEVTKLEEQEIKQRVARELGVKPGEDSAAAPNWMKESRRFSYIIKQGKFIDRLRPLVDRINREMEIAGVSAPGALDKPGIHYDPEIGDVDVVLPRSMLTDFLGKADEFERRMAEDAIISIEAVRLTDREIYEGAIASRMNAQIQGVHDVERWDRRRAFREVGLNSLLAIANQNLAVQTLGSIGTGSYPAGTPVPSIAPPTLPPIQVQPEATTIGTTFSIGADDVFFDGRQQTTGFSYIGPDGIAHTVTTDVVDSLRELWERIERNLIVHKIKKTGTLTEFSVPVGPNTRTYKGIAALISQENQQLIVATGTGAISEIKATAGTWLVIEDFVISPIPGSSTTLTREEKDAIRARIMLTMLLRDPFLSTEEKRRILAAGSIEQLAVRMDESYRENQYRSLRPGEGARTFGSLFEERLNSTLADEEFEKKEGNSNITLTFFSSQGNIIQSPGSTQLGDANDLTSFTTVLRPNLVTPISSFFTKSGNGLTGGSILTGMDRGERANTEKSMTHLVIRARFPTSFRERADREEGRFLGYFNLPIQREPSFDVDVPFLSSSEHPSERLAKLRVGLMFEVLDASRVKKPLDNANPNRFPGDVPRKAWETAVSRFLLIQKIISDAGGATDGIAIDYVSRFVTEVRALLEYDEDFFNSPNVALRNMGHWNDPDRVALALNNSPGRFALVRLVEMLDELGYKLLPDHYVYQFLAVSPPSGMKARKIYPLSTEQIIDLRRDVAAHYLRFQAAYGDAVLEAIFSILKLGTYRSKDPKTLEASLFRGYRDLVAFDNSGARVSDPDRFRAAHDDFLLLKRGGYRGKMFEKSMLSLEDLRPHYRSLIYRGPDILDDVAYNQRYRP